MKFLSPGLSVITPMVNDHDSFLIYRQGANVNSPPNYSDQVWKAPGSPIEASKAASQFRDFTLVPETSTKVPASAVQLLNPSDISPASNNITVPSSTVGGLESATAYGAQPGNRRAGDGLAAAAAIEGRVAVS